MAVGDVGDSYPGGRAHTWLKWLAVPGITGMVWAILSQPVFHNDTAWLYIRGYDTQAAREQSEGDRDSIPVIELSTESAVEGGTTSLFENPVVSDRRPAQEDAPSASASPASSSAAAAPVEAAAPASPAAAPMTVSQPVPDTATPAQPALQSPLPSATAPPRRSATVAIAIPNLDQAVAPSLPDSIPLNPQARPAPSVASRPQIPSTVPQPDTGSFSFPESGTGPAFSPTTPAAAASESDTPAPVAEPGAIATSPTPDTDSSAPAANPVEPAIPPSTAAGPLGPPLPAESLPADPSGDNASTALLEPPADILPDRLFVPEFEFVGNTVFNAQELTQIALAAIADADIATASADGDANSVLDAPVAISTRVNQYLSPADLIQASEAISQAYIDAGYITSGAFVPEAEIRQGNPVIQIVEGHLEGVQVALTQPDPRQLAIQVTPEVVQPPDFASPVQDRATEPAPPVTDPTVSQPLNSPGDTAPFEPGWPLPEISTAAVDLVDPVLETSLDPWAALTNWSVSPENSVGVLATTEPSYRLLVRTTASVEDWGQPLPAITANTPAAWVDPSLDVHSLEITGVHPLDPGYIASRLAIAGSAPLNIDRLVEGVQLLQLDPLIDRIATELAAGTQTGGSILNVTADQARSSQFAFVLDNGRSPSVGSLRQRAQLSQGNLLGLGDALSLGFSRTAGSQDWDVGYTVPISPYNTTLSFNAGFSDSEVIERAFTFLDLTSESEFYDITLRQPLIQTPSQEFSVSLIASQRESRSEFLRGFFGATGIPFPGSGADADGVTRISALRFGQDWIMREASQVFALQSEFSFGLNALNSTINPIPPDSRFFKWRGRAQWARLLAPDTLLLLRGDLQIADRPLVPQEQFTIGGANSVRGYRQDALLTDSGWIASAEVQVPVLRVPEISGLLQVAPFFDFGTGWNAGRFTRTPDTLAGLGIGAIWTQNNVSARLDWGMPLSPVTYERTNLQEAGIYFTLQITPDW